MDIKDKDFGDAELNNIYSKLGEASRKKIDALPMNQQILMLKAVVKREQAKKQEKEKEKKMVPVTPPLPPPNAVFEPVTPDMPPPPQATPKEVQDDFEEDEEQQQKEDELKPEKMSEKQKQFQLLIEQYYSRRPYNSTLLENHELEVRFGTRGVKPINKTDYDNVIKKLKSSGFQCFNESGEYRLGVQSKMLNKYTGRFELSKVRAEIYGLPQIQMYCKTNDIAKVMNNSPSSVKFVKKQYAPKTEQYVPRGQKIERIFPLNFDDFNFRVSYQIEEELSEARFIVDEWKKNQKTFRFINRVTFKHPDYPVLVDISVVKQSGLDENKRPLTYYTTEESGVFEKQEIYEIELELDNKAIGPNTKFNNPHAILEALRKVIKSVLSGLQGTNYPVSYVEQKEMLQEYMTLLFHDEYDKNKPVFNKYFIGPNSITLQKKNIVQVDQNLNIPNIRNDFVVTDKADGERHLMFISKEGKIYLINTNMNVIFTGAKTMNSDVFNTLVDGELISHNKKGMFINMYAAFDIYYLNGKDVRSQMFIYMDNKNANENIGEKEKEKRRKETRYYMLKKTLSELNALSIMENVAKKTSILSKTEYFASPIKIVCKKFYPENSDETIFQACNHIIQNDYNDLFEYTTDGLIFTHALFGVASDKIGVAGPLKKMTWNYSFKWKPPQYNTIDFLVRTIKTAGGDDVVKPLFENGVNMHLGTQLSEYKMIELRCTVYKNENIYANACQDIIDDKLPDLKNVDEKETSDTRAELFVPSSPYDPEAGLCKIMLKTDENNTKQMFTKEGEVFYDNTIVEFSYDFDLEKGWRWVPLRVRYDKTADMRQGGRNFGNSYHVANDNWKSIHDPITEEMITTGENIPDAMVDDDVYYNKSTGDTNKTEALKNFHNLYVKKMLIGGVSNRGDTLIDFACGKGGDLPKWIHAHLSFVFGIDYSSDNLTNPIDGACARYLNMRRDTKNMPYALFVNGNSSYNIRNGSAMLNEKAIQITKAVFGEGSSDPEKIGAGVARQYGKGADGFNISSCQFAIHYMFESIDSLQGFLRNVAECTKLNGYFIGTCYDGKEVFKMLKNKKPEEGVQVNADGKKIWEVVKEYNSNVFEDEASCLGYKINVYQESINQYIPEYLVNFDYLERVMEDYGFKLVEREEAHNMGLPEGSGMFREMFYRMNDEIKRNKFKEKDYKDAPNMSASEKQISFLNRYFVFKKVRYVNTSKVELELSEMNNMDVEVNKKDTKESVKIAKETVKKMKPRVKKLGKIVIEGSAPTPVEEVQQSQQEQPQEQEEKPKKKRVAKKLVIQE